MHLFFDESGDCRFGGEFDCYVQAALICPESQLDELNRAVEGKRDHLGVPELHAAELEGDVLVSLANLIAEREVQLLADVTDTILVLAVGLFLLVGVNPGSTYADLWPPMVLVGAGTGLAMTPMNVTAMNAIPTRESGAAGGVFTTLSGIGVGFGVAISGAIFNARQLSETEDLAATGGVALSKQKATQLDGLLAGAPGAERTLSSFADSAMDTVRDAVTDAFALGLGSAFRFGAAVAVGGLLLALLLIRDRPPADEVAAERKNASQAVPSGPPGGFS